MTTRKFTILITTKNRLDDLRFTLTKIDHLLQRQDVSCVLCDDGSTDGTSDFIKANYPAIHLIRNEKSRGLIYSRNKLLSLVQSDYAISIDDDLHFITENPLELIEDYFNAHPKCGLIGFRIFWSKDEPSSTQTSQQPHRMKSFPGGANVWRMEAWRQIPDYPAWFIFHGEEDFASYELFKKNIEIHYLPAVLVHHRVDLKARKKQSDYTIRLKRSLRSGWFLYFLFFPLIKIPRLLAYSIWMQLKLKVFKGDFKALQAIVLALFDLVIFFPKIVKNSNRLTLEEYRSYEKLPNIRLYWQPEK
ncbi:glycosyltransferase family 2 protein [Flavobacterium sp. CYK-4]|uniref:glycosyltransferase n=1 Tax=Flavobacterium lotistagni TaxID=2709660 RepID=UPI00140DB044|nr:glycosyltransferase family 2 protein [Flavobacterium lotistagni]NHM06413.1 glycosyltransferase family 2 protein [Flavobacterium lotistagni]